jgi:uncharacterized membrane protein YqjE
VATTDRERDTGQVIRDARRQQADLDSKVYYSQRGIDTEFLKHEPTGELIRRLITNAQALLDKQIALVKQELREDIQQVSGAGKTLGIGAGLLLVTLICFFNFLFLAIDTFLPRWGWAVALAFTLIFGIVGGVLAKRGVDQVKVQPLSRTRETLKEDVAWAKHPSTPNGRSTPSATTSQQPSAS